jgi:hypothetical protein
LAKIIKAALRVGNNAGMKRSGLIPLALLIGIALLIIPMCWVAYQLNWIRERHEFVSKHTGGVMTTAETANVQAPWSLQPFGERAAPMLWKVPDAFVEEARQLFPEAIVNPGPSHFQQQPAGPPNF